MRSKSRFTTLVLLETPGELSSDPRAIALYASRPLSPGATQHALPSGRYPLLGPVFHRLDRTSSPTGVPALDPLAYKLVLPPILERLRALRFHSDLVRLYLFLAVPQSLI